MALPTNMGDRPSRRDVIRNLVGGVALGSCPGSRLSSFAADGRPSGSLGPTKEFKSGAPVANYVDIAARVGLTAKTIIGGTKTKEYILETTGGGVALFDYDNDGWLDIFQVNGFRLNGLNTGDEPTNHLFRNNRDGSFTDVTEQAGLVHHGWGQGVCVGDYDGDGNL